MHLSVVVHLMASIHHVVAKSIEEIPMVREFSGCVSRSSARNAS
jgi:hypothetical protein